MISQTAFDGKCRRVEEVTSFSNLREEEIPTEVLAPSKLLATQWQPTHEPKKEKKKSLRQEERIK